MTYPIQWADRPCDNCKRKLGCPHSRLAGEFGLHAPAWMQSMYIEKQCKMNLIREENE